MPKKNWGENDKKVESREREQAKKSAAKDKQAKDKEDAYWAAAGEGDKSKAQAKREEEAKKKAEAAAKKAEIKRLAEEEEARLAAKPKSLGVAGVQKVIIISMETAWHCIAWHHCMDHCCCMVDLHADMNGGTGDHAPDT